jgi:hypothetical protein
MMIFPKLVERKTSCLYPGIPLILLIGFSLFVNPSRIYAMGEAPGSTATVIEQSVSTSKDEKPIAETAEQVSRIVVTLAGSIRDDESRPVDDATVTLRDFPSSSTTSDNGGNFRLQALSSDGSIFLGIFKEGYFPLYRSVPASPFRDQMPLVLILKPIPPAPVILTGIAASAAETDRVHIEADTLSRHHV